MGRIYVVEPTGSFSDDPNVTDKKFVGNPTNSYRTLEQLCIVAEVTGWRGHSSEVIQARKESVAKLLQTGAQIIEE